MHWTRCSSFPGAVISKKSADAKLSFANMILHCSFPCWLPSAKRASLLAYSSDPSAFAMIEPMSGICTPLVSEISRMLGGIVHSIASSNY